MDKLAADVQLTDLNEYTTTNPQHVVVKGSIKHKLPPGLTIKSSHIRIGEPIGQGNLNIIVHIILGILCK